MLHFLSLTTVLFHDCWSTLPWSFKFDSQPLASCWEIRNWSQYFALLCIAHCSRALMSLVLILTTIVMMVMCTVECLCWTWFSQSFGFLRLLFWRSAFGNKWHRIFLPHDAMLAQYLLLLCVCLSVHYQPLFYRNDWLIELVFGMEASFHLSTLCYNAVWVRPKNKGTSLWNFAPKSGHRKFLSQSRSCQQNSSTVEPVYDTCNGWCCGYLLYNGQP